MLTTEVTVGGGFVLDCFILKGSSNILPTPFTLIFYFRQSTHNDISFSALLGIS